MWALYSVIKNYGVAIVLFTFITKALLFPLSIKQQKGTALMASFQPKLAAIQKKYPNNKEKLQEEQMKLYAEEGVNPMGSCLPMIIQFPVLFGIIDVVYRPMTHIMHFSKELIAQASEVALKVIPIAQANGELVKVNLTNFDKAYQQQLFIMQAYNYDPAAFSGIGGNFIEQVSTFNMNLFGVIDLGANPTMGFPMILIPILAGVSQLALTVYMQWYQKKTNPAMKSMGAMNLLMYLMPLMSVWFAFSLPAGVGFYWIIQSICSFIQTIVLNKIYTPEKVAEMNAHDQKKKKKKGPSYMQRAMEQQKAMEAQKSGKPIPTTASSKAKGEDTEEIKLSKSAMKDVSSRVISEARKRYAEKYGDDYED